MEKIIIKENLIKIGRKYHKFCANYISCGVRVIFELPSNQKISSWKKTISEKDLVKYFDQIFDKMCLLKKKRHLIFSDTEKGGREFGKILDKVCKTSTPYGRNPNTGNNIKVWVYTKKD
jgi:hypothetical protein